MTSEEYYWRVRRPQILRAYAAHQAMMPKPVGVGGSYAEHQLSPYLSELWFDDYKEDYNLVKEMPTSKSLVARCCAIVPMGSCSSVRKGNFHGRNFDFTFDTSKTYVVHSRANGGRHAFVGMAKATSIDGNQPICNMPNLMKDGINDCGVVININVVAKKDIDDAGLGNTETQMGRGLPKVHQAGVPSYVLAYANSAIDAVKIMKERINIYGYLPVKGGLTDEHLHYMISDIDNTFTVEIIGNKVCVIGYAMNKPGANEEVGAYVDEINLHNPIMTNWWLNFHEIGKSRPSALVKDGKYTMYACGIERYAMLNSNYGNDDMTMFDLMRSAKYTNEMDFEPDNPDFPFSDIGAGCIYGYDEYLKGGLFKKYVDEDRKKMRYALDNDDRTLGIWFTSHHTTYDIKNKSFVLAFEEDYGNPMRFSLD